MPGEIEGKSTGKVENPLGPDTEGGAGSEDGAALGVDPGTTTTCWQWGQRTCSPRR